MKLLILFIASLALSANAENIRSVEIHNKESINLNAEVFRVAAPEAPTVIVLHGCGGVDSHHTSWARQLNTWGFNAVVLDSFSSRGERSVCKKSFSVTPSQRAVDMQYAAKWIASQAWGKSKIGDIGFSHGAWGTLYAVSKKEIAREVGETLVSSAVAFYPYCDSSRFFDSPAMPVQIHIGNNDTWTPATACKDLARNWNTADDYFAYADSFHGFDREDTNVSVAGASSAGVENHTLRSNPVANELARSRVKVFFDKTLLEK